MKEERKRKKGSEGRREERCQGRKERKELTDGCTTFSFGQSQERSQKVVRMVQKQNSSSIR
jgi:hypothetical protein